MSGPEREDRLGIPPQNGRSEGPMDECEDKSAEETGEREGNGTGTGDAAESSRASHAGIPPAPARDARPATEEEKARSRRTGETAGEEEAERRVERFLEESQHIFHLPGFIFHPMVILFLVGAAGLLSLFVLSQLASTLAALRELPVLLQYVGWGALLLIVAAVLFAGFRLLWWYLRLRRNRQVPLPGLREVARRTELRHAARQKKAEAVTRIKSYLEDYPPLDGAGMRDTLLDYGLSKGDVREMEKARKRLLDSDGFGGPEGWLQDFRSSFQNHLDTAARKRRGYCARRTAIKTAVSPNPLIDSLVTLYYGYTLIGDLCRIYRLRAGVTGTALIAGHVFVNAYLAGKADEAEEVTESFVDSLFGAGGKLASEIAGKAVSKTGAGAFNYLLMHRLGKTGAGLLRPVET